MALGRIRSVRFVSDLSLIRTGWPILSDMLSPGLTMVLDAGGVGQGQVGWAEYLRILLPSASKDGMPIPQQRK